MSIKGSANGKGGEWWEGEKNVDSEKKYKRGLSVYACVSDTTHPKVLQLANNAGLFKEGRYDELLSTETPELNNDEVSIILESFFGFNKGDYEEHLIEGIQQTRFKQVAVNEVRYCGEERTDKQWCSTGLASNEAKEYCKFGSIVNMEEQKGVGEMVIRDAW